MQHSHTEASNQTVHTSQLCLVPRKIQAQHSQLPLLLRMWVIHRLQSGGPLILEEAYCFSVQVPMQVPGWCALFPHR